MWKRALGLTSVSSVMGCGAMWRTRCGASCAAGDDVGGIPATTAPLHTNEATTTPLHTDEIDVDGRRVLVCTPPNYPASKRFDVLYVLDCGHRFFAHVADAQRRCAETTRHQVDRQWYPEVIVVGVSGPRPADADVLLRYVTDSVIPYVDEAYQTKPYAAARAVVGYDDGALGGLAVRKMLISAGDEAERRRKLFRFYLVGSAGGGAPSGGGGSQPSVQPQQLPDRLSVYMGVHCDLALEKLQAARALAASLESRTTVRAERSMFVNREGQQTCARRASDTAVSGPCRPEAPPASEGSPTGELPYAYYVLATAGSCPPPRAPNLTSDACTLAQTRTRAWRVDLRLSSSRSSEPEATWEAATRPLRKPPPAGSAAVWRRRSSRASAAYSRGMSSSRHSVAAVGGQHLICI